MWKTLMAVTVCGMCLALTACNHNVEVDHKMKIDGQMNGTINHNHKIDLPKNIEIHGPLGGKLGNIKINPDQPQKQ